MAYITTVAKSCANRDAAIAEIHTQLLAMGWSYVDGMCNSYTVPYTDVSIANDTITVAAGHNYTNSQPVQLYTTGTAPTGLAINTRYFVVGVSGNTFKLSATYNGSAINITGQGTGNHTIAECYRVYSSNAEAADRIPECILISIYASAANIQFWGYYGWNLTTRSGLGGAYASGTVTINSTGFYLWIHGDKNTVHIVTKVGSTYYKNFFGHYQPFTFAAVLTTSSITAGSSVSIPVASSANFRVGNTYMIVGCANEGRETFTVTAIADATHITANIVAVGYASGALIGFNPSCFGVFNASLAFYTTCVYGVTGTTNNGSSTNTAMSNLFPYGACDPDYRTGEYILQPLGFGAITNGSGNVSAGGYGFDKILNLSIGALVSEDTLVVGLLDSGTSSTTGDSTTLTDITKSWTVNAYANKVVIITFGTGQGQLKKIASNTATALTLASGYTFETPPNNTSQYSICDEGYRAFCAETAANINCACREGI